MFHGRASRLRLRITPEIFHSLLPLRYIIRRAIRYVSKSHRGVMNKILLGSVALAAMLTGPAMAADYAPRRAATTFVEPAASWTGFYIGGNIGGVWGNTDPGFIAGCPPSVGAGTIQGGVLPNLPSATC